MTPFACGRPDVVAAEIDRMNRNFPMLPRAWASLGLHYLGGSYGLDRLVLVTPFAVPTLKVLERRTLAADAMILDWFAGTLMLGLPGNDETFRLGFETKQTAGVLLPAGDAERLGLHDIAPYITDPGLGSLWGAAWRSIGAGFSNSLLNCVMHLPQQQMLMVR